MGDVRAIESAFTFENSDPDNYRWQPTWGGGALLDVGCYQAHVWTAIAGVDAQVVVNHVERSMSSTGIDSTTSAVATINGGISAQMQCSFVLPPQQQLVISSAEHRLHMHAGEAFTSWREPSSLRIDDVTESFPAVDAFQIMVEEVSARINGESGWIVPLDESVKVAHILDEIAAAPSRS